MVYYSSSESRQMKRVIDSFKKGMFVLKLLKIWSALRLVLKLKLFKSRKLDVAPILIFFYIILFRENYMVP